MSQKRNSIKSKKGGVEVSLDPTFLINHAAYMPDGETIVQSNMTIGQLVEAIAFAHIKAKTPQFSELCGFATVKFENGKFMVTFADSVENLTF